MRVGNRRHRYRARSTVSSPTLSHADFRPGGQAPRSIFHRARSKLRERDGGRKLPVCRNINIIIVIAPNQGDGFFSSRDEVQGKRPVLYSRIFRHCQGQPPHSITDEKRPTATAIDFSHSLHATNQRSNDNQPRPSSFPPREQASERPAVWA